MHQRSLGPLCLQSAPSERLHLASQPVYGRGTQAGTVQAAAANQRADQHQQIAQRQQQAIASMAPIVSTLAQKVTDVSNAVHAAAASTPGDRMLSIGAPDGPPKQVVQIDPSDLETMRASAAEVQATINSIARS